MAQPLHARIFFQRLKRTCSLMGCVFIFGCTLLFKTYEKRAYAVLLPTIGSTVHGTIAFVEHADGLQVSYSLQGLAAHRTYGFQIHEYGNCRARDARSAGDIFALMRHRRAALDPEGHMPNIHADANGAATGFMMVNALALDGIRSIINRAVVVLQTTREASVQGDAEVRLACGVVQRQ